MKLIYWNNKAENRDDTSKPMILMPKFGADKVREIEESVVCSLRLTLM